MKKVYREKKVEVPRISGDVQPLASVITDAWDFSLVFLNPTTLWMGFSIGAPGMRGEQRWEEGSSPRPTLSRSKRGGSEEKEDNVRGA